MANLPARKLLVADLDREASKGKRPRTPTELSLVRFPTLRARPEISLDPGLEPAFVGHLQACMDPPAFILHSKSAAPFLLASRITRDPPSAQDLHAFATS